MPQQIANNADGFPLPGKNVGALVGKIGKNPPFFIGTNDPTVKFNQTGILYLSINDYKAALFDNAGTLKVKISAK